MKKQFMVIIDQECDSGAWWCWISPLDAMGKQLDEFRTRTYNKRKAAIDRMVEICHKLTDDLGGEAAKEIRRVAKEDK